jgi:integrase
LNFYLDRRRGDELRWFWAATAELEVPYRNFVRTLVLTGQRRDEVSGMRAEELNDDCSEWVIPAQRVKNGREHRVPLPKLVSDIVRASIGDRPGSSGFVFTADSRQITGYSVLKRKLDAKMMTIALAENAGAKIDRWTLHDLRRTAATAMIELGVASNVVEAILNHVSGSRAGVAGVYDRSQLPGPKRNALEKWARHVELVVNGKTSKVVPMRKAN